MSVLNKLKELVSMIEEEVATPKPEETPEEQPEETPEEQLEEIEEEIEEEVEDLDPPDRVDCTEQESLAIRTLIQKENKYYASLGELVVTLEKMNLAYENQKNSILKDIKTNRSYYLEQLDLLRTQYNLPSKGYEILLPLAETELLRFVKAASKAES